MADPTQMAPGAQPPYLDPSAYPDYLALQKKQMLAQMLTGAMQQAGQTPDNWDSMKVVPRRSPLQGVAQLAAALAAGKANRGVFDAQQNYFQKLYSPQPQAGNQSPQTLPGDPASAALDASGAAPAPPRNPMLLPGQTPQTSQAILGMTGPQEYGKALIAQNAPLEIVRQLRAAGVDPNSPQGQVMVRNIIAKQGANVQDVRPGSTMVDVNTGRPMFTGPDNGINTTWENGQPKNAVIPGSTAAIQATQKAKTVGTQTATPMKLGTDENGRDIYGYPAPPGSPGTPNATAPGTTASPGQVQGQKSGAEAGATYASELAKNASGATEVRRSIAELKNLAGQATPSAANEAKAKLGAFMIAAGANPENVSKWTGVDTGALQAAQTQTATLAVNLIHSMTSRGTNFDLDTFMRNNPNLNMADPAAFGRVADYMDNKAKQEIAKQKDFVQWKKGVAPEDWESGHTAHWLEQQNTAIDAGLSNSKPPAPKPAFTLQELQAEAKRRGLKVPTP